MLEEALEGGWSAARSNFDGRVASEAGGKLKKDAKSMGVTFDLKRTTHVGAALWVEVDYHEGTCADNASGKKVGSGRIPANDKNGILQLTLFNIC